MWDWREQMYWGYRSADFGCHCAFVAEGDHRDADIMLELLVDWPRGIRAWESDFTRGLFTASRAFYSLALEELL